jgi:hypothetical protein
MLAKALAELFVKPNMSRELLWEENRFTCEMSNEFWKIADEHVIVPTDDKRSLAEFPLVGLKECFIHEKTLPILNYGQQALYDVLEGLQLHMLSDVYWKQRSPAWIHQCLQLLELIFIRCTAISNEPNASLALLNMKEYRVMYEMELTTNVIAAYVNREFLFDMGEMIIMILETCYEEMPYWDENPLMIVEHEDVSALYKHIRKDCSKLRDEIVTRHRRVYYEHMMLTKSDERIFSRRDKFAYRTKAREILVNKNDHVYDDKEHCASKVEVLAPRRIQHPRERIMEQISMDAMFDYMISTFKWELPMKYVRTMALWRLKIEGDPALFFETRTEAFTNLRRTSKTDAASKFTVFDPYILVTTQNQTSDNTATLLPKPISALAAKAIAADNTIEAVQKRVAPPQVDYSSKKKKIVQRYEEIED